MNFAAILLTLSNATTTTTKATPSKYLVQHANTCHELEGIKFDACFCRNVSDSHLWSGEDIQYHTRICSLGYVIYGNIQELLKIKNVPREYLQMVLAKDRQKSQALEFRASLLSIIKVNSKNVLLRRKINHLIVEMAQKAIDFTLIPAIYLLKLFSLVPQKRKTLDTLNAFRVFLHDEQDTENFNYLVGVYTAFPDLLCVTAVSDSIFRIFRDSEGPIEFSATQYFYFLSLLPERMQSIKRILEYKHFFTNEKESQKLAFIVSFLRHFEFVGQSLPYIDNVVMWKLYLIVERWAYDGEEAFKATEYMYLVSYSPPSLHNLRKIHECDGFVAADDGKKIDFARSLVKTVIRSSTTIEYSEANSGECMGLGTKISKLLLQFSRILQDPHFDHSLTASQFLSLIWQFPEAFGEYRQFVFDESQICILQKIDVFFTIWKPSLFLVKKSTLFHIFSKYLEKAGNGLTAHALLSVLRMVRTKFNEQIELLLRSSLELMSEPHELEFMVAVCDLVSECRQTPTNIVIDLASKMAKYLNAAYLFGEEPFAVIEMHPETISLVPLLPLADGMRSVCQEAVTHTSSLPIQEQQAFIDTFKEMLQTLHCKRQAHAGGDVLMVELLAVIQRGSGHSQLLQLLPELLESQRGDPNELEYARLLESYSFSIANRDQSAINTSVLGAFIVIAKVISVVEFTGARDEIPPSSLHALLTCQDDAIYNALVRCKICSADGSVLGCIASLYEAAAGGGGGSEGKQENN